MNRQPWSLPESSDWGLSRKEGAWDSMGAILALPPSLWALVRVPAPLSQKSPVAHLHVCGGSLFGPDEADFQATRLTGLSSGD